MLHPLGGGGDATDPLSGLSVGYLQRKIEQDTAQPRQVLTKIGVGYRFEGRGGGVKALNRASNHSAEALYARVNVQSRAHRQAQAACTAIRWADFSPTNYRLPSATLC